jgi:hypothetical protein
MRIALRVSLLPILAASLAAQHTTWTSFADRRGHAMARGPNGTVVMFGGQSMTSGELLRDTDQLSANLTSWSSAAEGPAPRTEHAMAAATVSGQPVYVVFGGLNNGGTPTNTTWRYDGSAWGDLPPGVVPAARSGHSMVTHLGSQTMLMFGGFDGTSSLGDLWSFQAASNTWAPQSPGGTPPTPRSEMCMAHCSLNGKVYVFGGTPFLNDLYEYDLAANTWVQRTPANPPPGRRKAAMTFVNGAGAMVMFGGLRFGAALNDTWLYDPVANQWYQPPVTVSPPARYDHAMSVGATGNRMVLLGGTNNANAIFEATWVWDANTFDWVEALPAPSSRNGAAMAYDSARDRHVVFGGRDVTTGLDLDETWEIDGLNWRKMTPSPRPSVRSDAAMGFMPGLNKTILFGGRSSAGFDFSDTWEWTGQTWTRRTFLPNQVSPPARSGLQAAYNDVLGVLCLPIPGFQNLEMYTYDGTLWSVVPASGPQPVSRINYGCAYDRRRDRVVVFGGQIGASFTDETWEWNGSSWTQFVMSVAPMPRGRCRMAYDPHRSRVVMFGGTDGIYLWNDTWEWNGAAWHHRITPTSPPPSWTHDLTFDQSRKLAVAFGGFGTWDYGPVVPASATTYGFGCATSGSNPPGFPMQLKPLPWSGPWLGDRLEIDFENRPALSLGVFVWGFSRTFSPSFGPLPFNLTLLGSPPGCALRADPMVSELIFPATQRYVSFVLPNHPSFLGAVMYGQAGFFDPGLPGSPVVTSNGLEMVFGQK